MARIINLAHEAAGIQSRYLKVHKEIFHVSLRRAILASVLNKTPDYASQVRELFALHARVKEIQAAVADLGPDELTKRLRGEIRSALAKYLSALSTALGRLREICTRLKQEQEGDEEYLDYSRTRFKKDTVAYDDSVQEYQLWGERLNALFADY